MLIRTPITPNGVTWLMIVVGVLAAARADAARASAAAVGGVRADPAAAAARLLRRRARALARQSPRPPGIYLDRLGHYLTEPPLPIALGIRADGGWHHLGGWTTLGLLISVLVLLVKSETALVHVARAESGLPPAKDTRRGRGAAGERARGAAPRRSAALPFFRAFVAIEFTLLRWRLRGRRDRRRPRRHDAA